VTMLKTNAAAILVALAIATPALAADYSCEGLVPVGKTMICSGFEPNWAVKLTCSGTTMTATFVDAFSGAGIQETPGSVRFSSSNPWSFTTSHGIKGSIAYTPAGCTDESDAVRDFTITPTAAPGLSGPFFPFCCRFQ
jgi:hypothetical protein